MARNFSGSNELSNSTLVVPSTAGSFVGRWKPTYVPTDGVGHVLFDQRLLGSEPGNTISITKWSDNNWYVGWLSGSVDYRVSTPASGTFVQNSDHVLVLTWDVAAQETKFFINGTQVGATSTSLVTFTPDTAFLIGRADPAAGIFSIEAALAECAIYTEALPGPDIQALNVFSPLLVRRSVLRNYWPLLGRTSPEIELVSRAEGTLKGTTVADHPRVIYPSRRRSAWPRTVVVPPSTGVSWLPIQLVAGSPLDRMIPSGAS